MTLATEFDTWVASIGTRTGLTVTRDPDMIHPTCVLVGTPDVESATLDGVTMRVPVWLIAPGGGKPAGTVLLDNVMALVGLDEFLDSATSTTTTITGVEFHAYLLAARIYTTP